MRAAASRTFCTAGRSRPMSTAIIAITTSSSINVKADLRRKNMANHPRVAWNDRFSRYHAGTTASTGNLTKLSFSPTGRRGRLRLLPAEQLVEAEPHLLAVTRLQDRRVYLRRQVALEVRL